MVLMVKSLRGKCAASRPAQPNQYNQSVTPPASLIPTVPNLPVSSRSPGEPNVSRTSANDLAIGWGDAPPVIDDFSTMRVVYQNVNGLNLSSPSTQFLFGNLQALQCGVFLAAETNVNWKNRSEVDKYKALVHKYWPSHRMVYSSSAVGYERQHRRSAYLPGGTAIWVSNYWSTRVLECGEDDSGLGRWCFVTLGTKKGVKVTIIVVYRVCLQSVTTAGALTATRQQVDLLETQRGRSASRTLINPRSQLSKDITVFIRHKQSEGHRFILAGEKNETYLEGRYADGSAKSGSMEQVFDACKLEDALFLRHGAYPTTSTTTVGRYIDALCVAGVDVLASGILPLQSTKDSDHLPFFMDWDAAAVLGGPASPLTRPVQRRLSVKNQLCVSKYLDAAISQSTYHILETRVDRLTDVFFANGRQLPPHAKQALYNIDLQSLEIVTAAEAGCSRKGIHQIPWCPDYKSAGLMVSYLEYRLKEPTHMGDAVSRKLGKRAGLTIADMDYCYLPADCKQDLKDARKWLSQLKLEASQRRELFQDISADIAAQGDDKKKLGILKSIKDAEKSSRRFRNIAAALGKTRKGLDKVIISNPDGTETILIEKDAMDEALLARNYRHYGQANETYFGAEGGSSHLIDPENPDNITDNLLDGTADFDIRHLSSESREWLGELVRISVDDVSLQITEQDFIDHYKPMPERKSSSPSLKHVGHYKVAACCEDGTLRRISIKIMQLALWASAPLPRWGHCILTMLEKGKGPGLENLRIIQIVESDLNFILGCIWGKRLCTRATGLHPAQFATKGQLCHSAALTTVLFADIHRQTRQPAAVAMLDARACFDRDLPAMSIPVSMKFGLPKEAALFLYHTLRNMTFKVATAHGISDNSFSALQNASRPLQGYGQGTGSAPPGHLLIADIGNTALAKHHPSALLRHPSPSGPTVKQQISMFMDDATLYSNLDSITRSTMRRFGWTRKSSVAVVLQHLIRTYSKYLWTGGGRLNLSKCYWYLMQYMRRSDGRYVMVSAMDSPFDMSIQEETDEGAFLTVPQLDPSNCQRGLGIHFSPSGKSIGQRGVLLLKATAWANSIRASNLTSSDIWVAYCSVLWPGLCYPLAISSLSDGDLRLVQQKLSTILRHSLHLNRSFPDALFYGAKRYGGLGVVPLFAQQLYMKLSLFLRHVRACDDVGKQLLISMGHTQLELGVDTSFLQLSFLDYKVYITPTWLTNLWEYLSRAGITLLHSSTEQVWVPSLQRESDSFLMSHLQCSIFSSDAKRLINEWRIYLRAITMADLVSSDGSHITPDIYFGWRSFERTSSLRWPVASRPHLGSLHHWQSFLASFIASGRLLKYPLGSWFPQAACHKTWNFKLDPHGGLWRRERRRDSYVELFPSLSRSANSRKLFYRTRLLEPVSRAPSHRLAAWRYADITERGHYSRPTEFVSVNQPSYFSYVVSPGTVSFSPPAPAITMPLCGTSEYNHFRFCLRNMDLLRLQHLGLLSGNMSSADVFVNSVLPDGLIPSEPAVQYIVNLFSMNDLWCVSDGSYEQRIGKASHAWVLTNEASLFRLDGAGPSDGDPVSLSSFRPELQGVLAIMIMLRTIEDSYSSIPAGSRATIVCDNESATKVLRKISQDRFYLVDPHQTDSDLLLEIQGEMLRSHMSYTILWIRSHQDDVVPVADLPFLAVLNVDCDRRAKLYLKHHHDIHPPPSVFSSERWGAVWGGFKITARLKQAIFELSTRETSTAYLRHKFKWDLLQCGTIHWQGIDNAKSKLSMSRNAFVSKAMFDKLPIAVRLHLYEPAESPLCRCCNQLDESQLHLYQCQDPATRQHRLHCWTACMSNILTTGHTSRIIMDAIDSNLREFLCLPPRQTNWQSSQGNRSVFSATQHAIAAQSQLGWDRLLFGFASVRWEFAQGVYRSVSGDVPRRPLRTWTEGLVSSFWDFSFAIWSYRNEVKHGATKSDQALLARARLTSLVIEKYNHRPHLADRYRWLYGKPLYERLKEGNRSLHVWLTSLRNFSSLSEGLVQTTIVKHATVVRLSEDALGRLRRPKRLRRLAHCTMAPLTRRFPLGTPPPTTTQSLPAMWNFTPQRPPVIRVSKKKRIKSVVRSKSIKMLFDRGRFPTRSV